MFKKIIFTFGKLKKIAYHHYGNNPLSLIKFIYYSFFRINTFIVFECDLTKPLPQIDLDPEFKMIQPTMDQLDRLRSGKELPREFYYDQFRKVRTCYLALCGNEMAYIQWIFFKGDNSRFLRLGQDIVEINYMTTLPQFRGKKLSSQMLVSSSKRLRESGYKKAVIVVHENTVALIKNLKEAGFRELKRMKTIGPFNRKVQV